MDHRAFVANLPESDLAQLNAPDDIHGLRHLAGHAGLIVLFGSWIAAGLPLWQVVLVGHGAALCFLFTLEHEATHATPFRTTWINETVGRICGALILLPFEWFRYFHFAHHRWTNDPDKDPELRAGAKPEGWLAYAIYVSGLTYWYGMARQLVRNALGYDPGDFVPQRARGRVKAEARWLLFLYAAAALSLLFTPLLFWIWILPCLLGQPFLRLYLLAEHGRCAFVANMFENTRTTYTNRAVRFLAWNMPYHVEHHAMPQVPFHKLLALNRLMQGHHQVVSDGYGKFTRDYVDEFSA